MQPLIIRVDGIPKGQPRARKGQHGWYTPSMIKAWKDDLAAALIPHRPAKPLDGPLELILWFYLPRPQRLDHKSDPDGPVLAPVMPDFDNLEAPTANVLQSIGFIQNDKLICHSDTWKCYHRKGGTPGVVLQLKPCPPVPSHVMWWEGLCGYPEGVKTETTND